MKSSEQMWGTGRARASKPACLAICRERAAYVGESTLMPDPVAAHSRSANASKQRAKVASVRRCLR